MAQEGRSRPADLTDAQVQELAVGKSSGFGGTTRPKDLTDQDIEALRQGKKVDMEKIPELKPTAHD
jgi:hypothetical protein